MTSYMAVKEKLEAMINEGELKVGEKLASEHQMAKFFGVSRDTFRSAIKLLEKERKILVKHGVGTFVVQPPPSISNNLEDLRSIGELIKSSGLKEGERQERITLEKCPKQFASLLRIQAGEPVYFLKRARTADNEPVVFSVNLIPKAVVGDVFERKPFSGSLLSYLQVECGLSILDADTEIVVPPLSDKYVKRLMCKPETMVLLLKSIHLDEKNQVVMYSLDYLRNDVFSFWIRRARK
ncbi:GntR family transcriptional regulator [Sporolactobacillus inulinus]|uniref:Transcriptional regulator n=1 Tax=Sporolactobacillus inulinus CASD TaxID=1069536 RepID=A0A0U1QQ83_9BACL|nr:GntR family transcriptional regulator [Sporolactobacillus inulinus]KLI02949.1 transcriptional regulator [Sporolactobacillus inulinus CASD]GEB76594.1 putative HTH-type transcriptional regulator YmfC [Sporolactobacillus inulinus]